jgi:hypothetical protein
MLYDRAGNMRTTLDSVPVQAPRVARRAVVLAALVGVVGGVYACSDGTAPSRPPAGARVLATPSATTVVPGVVTLCKVGPGATFDVQVGLTASVQQMSVKEGQCATLPTITAAPGDDVIVTIRETPEPYYALDHIVLQHGDGTPQTITGTSSVSFEGVHGANVTYYNDGVVRVCKQGTNATFQYEVGLGDGFNGLSLTNGECANIARIPPVAGDDVVVSIRENSSPGYQLNHIAFTHGDLPPVNLTGPNGLSFEGMHGGLVVFYNDPVEQRGCTYTQGWYKNKGSVTLPGGNFYLSATTWLGVLQMEPKGGNPYYILAHQFIAASLNSAAASTPPAVSAALASATTYFGVATPDNWSAGGAYTKSQLTAWADLLGDYNEGSIGPGHCE